MALITCGECGSKISDTADRCPACGAETDRFKERVAKNTKGFYIFMSCFFAYVFWMISMLDKCTTWN